MEKIEFRMENGRGGFYVMRDEVQLGEMTVSRAGSVLTVHHTGVLPEGEGQGLAGRMMEAMVAYARDNGLQVVPLCSYVQARFSRGAGSYDDVWKK